SRVQLHAQLADTTGATRGEFLLADADEIQVFSKAQFRPDRYVAITGAVRHPGRYPYRAGMTLRDVALLAGGFNEGASLDAAEVAHMATNRSGGSEAVTERVRLDSSYAFASDPRSGRNGGAPGRDAGDDRPEAREEIALRPYDNVLILRQENFSLPRTVTLHGEVRMPGEYTLRSKSERLADVVARAGGFTTEAYVPGATLRRAADSLGFIGIDVAAVVRDPRNRDNVTLEDGDVLTVPRYEGVVVVKGAVHSPTTVAYVPGRSLSYYIQAAGGATEQADVRAAFVREPNGRIESVRHHRFAPDGSPEPLAGAVVTVPVKDATQPHRDLAPLLAGLGSSLAAVVGLIAVTKK
ncbi:MAG TPA: SLBB domain-containing protein, partial [Gemmatirosa sp.]